MTNYQGMKLFSLTKMEKLLKLCSNDTHKSYSNILCEETIFILKTWEIFAINRRFSCFNDETEMLNTEPFFFIQGSDIQFGMIQRLLEKKAVPGWDREIELAEMAVMKINRMKPKPRFFVICGDLCDATPQEEPEIRKKQEVDFKKIFGKLDRSIPLVCVCGNHDIDDHPTKESVMSYRESFGDDFFSFWCGGIFFIVINTQYYYDSSMVVEFAKEQEEWLDRTLRVAESSGKRVIVFQHIPWFLRKADDVDLTEYYSIEQDIRMTMLEKLRRAGVRYVFAGHYHRNCAGRYDTLEMITTSAIGGQMGFDVSGLRIVRCLETEIHHTYYSLENFPRIVDL